MNANEPETQVLRLDPPDYKMSLIAEALEKRTDPEAMKGLYALVQQMREDEAKQEFALAMNDCQRSMPAIARDAENKHTKSTYAKLETINAAITPVYASKGFSISFSEEDCPIEGSARVVAVLQHVAGHAKTFRLDIPLDGTGVKGAANMTGTQGKGSTIAYARRYLVCMMFNLVIGGEDNDGNGALIGDKSIEMLNNLIEDCEKAGAPVDMKKFLAIKQIADLGEIRQADLPWYIDQLTRKHREALAKKGQK